MNKFLDFFKNLLSAVDHAFHAFVDFAIPEAKKIIINDIMPIVKEVVAIYITKSDMTGDQKKAAALADIQASLKTAGKDASVSLINWAIETAYQALQNAPAVAPAAPAAAAPGA